jgi:cardiolipin synthase
MFLEMWDYVTGEETDYALYRSKSAVAVDAYSQEGGFVQPYSDSPLDHEDVGENVYLHLIEHAQNYVYIFTPYLILGSEMRTALVNAAKYGVDVRIVVPAIPDKKLVYLLTQSEFSRLIKAGVKIYKYTPGFIHSKCFVVDDVHATVGTVNLDYRSLYLHFECGTYLYRTKAVMQVKEDALRTFEVSHEVTLEECQNRLAIVRMFMGALKLFAPLL